MILINVYNGQEKLAQFTDPGLAEWFSKEYGRVIDAELYTDVQGDLG